MIADRADKIKRIQERDKSQISEIEARMNNQWSDEKKLKLADIVIENKDLSNTQKEVRKIHQNLLKTS